MVRTPAQAIAYSKTITRGYGGQCLKFVRTCVGVGSKYGSAKEAWANAQFKHVGLNGIPAGVPIFMSHPKSKYGHVAIYLGNGYIRTTNSSTNRIHTDPISKWQGWGYTVQGWTEDLNGVRVWSAPVAQPNPVPAPTGGANILWQGLYNNAAVKHYQSEMNRVFPKYSHLRPDGDYGPATAAITREFQRRSALSQTGNVDIATKNALIRNGVRF